MTFRPLYPSAAILPGVSSLCHLSNLWLIPLSNFELLGHFHSLQNLLKRVVGRHTFEFRRGAQHHAMAQRWKGCAFDVVRRNEVAAFEAGEALGPHEEVESGARAGAHQQVRIVARRRHEGTHVPHDLRAHKRAAYGLLGPEHFVARRDLLYVKTREGVAIRRGVVFVENAFLGRRVGIPDDDLEHEPVKLGEGERIGALMLDGVLRREDDKRLRQQVHLFFLADRGFLHGFEESRLRLGGRAIDLVRQNEVRENGTFAKDEFPALRPEHVRAADVVGQKVRCKLDPSEIEGERRGDGPHQRCLGGARNALEQDVPVGEKGGQAIGDDIALAVDDFLYFVERSTVERGDLVGCGRAWCNRFRLSGIRHDSNLF